MKKVPAELVKKPLRGYEERPGGRIL